MGLSRSFIVIVGLSVLAALGSAFLVETVPVAKIGVKQSLWGGGGVIETDYDTGFHIGITGVHKWHMLDARTHFVHFGSEGAAGKMDQPIHTSSGLAYPSLALRTKDNNMLSIDVTVTYRIKPDLAHKLVAEGKQMVYPDRVVQIIEKELREQMAVLASDEVILSDRRLQVVQETLPSLAVAMDEYHVQPESILIRAISFPPGYEQKLQDKQLEEQNNLLAISQKIVEDWQAKTEGMSAETLAKEKDLIAQWNRKLQSMRSANLVDIQGIISEAQRYDKETRAQADANYQVMVATGQLAIEKAEALRDELRNQALNTAGGRILLARQAAENLNIEHVTLNSNDPRVPSVLDINALTDLLIGQDRK